MGPAQLTGLIIGIIAGIFGMITGAHFLWRKYREHVPQNIFWRKVERGIVELIELLRRDNFVPDVIVGIGRSGAIFGGLLAGNMKNLPIALMDRSFHWEEQSRQSVPSGFTSVALDESCKKVLIVIGEVYSGQSISQAIDMLEPQLRGRRFRTACLVQSKQATFQTDHPVFEVTETKRPPWFITDEYLRYETGS